MNLRVFFVIFAYETGLLRKFSLQRMWSALPFAMGGMIVASAGCGSGHGNVSVLPVRTEHSATRGASVIRLTGTPNVLFSVGVTPKSSKWPSTQSVVISAPGISSVIINVTKSSSDCQSNPNLQGSYICSGSTTLPAGNVTFTLTAHSATGGTGSVLSASSSGVVTVPPSGSVTVPMVFSGTATYVVLSLGRTDPPVGKSLTIPLTVIVEDSNGALIIGSTAFAYPITLSASDPANGPISKTTLKSPADIAGITTHYDGAKIASITYSASATKLPPANVTSAILKPGSNTIYSASRTIGPSGGLLPLPDGSNVAIPSGVFASDVTVTLVESSSTTTQPPNPYFLPNGPSLTVQFGGPTNSIAPVTSPLPVNKLPPNETLTFNVPASFNPSADLATLHLTGSDGTVGDLAINQFVAGNTVIVSLPTSDIQRLADEEVYFTQNVPPSNPTQQLRPDISTSGVLQVINHAWTSTLQVDRSKPTALFVHGIFSSVESAYPEEDGVTCAENIAQQLGDKQILGVDYNWTEGLGQTGEQINDLLDLDNPSPVFNDYPIDIIGHSYGTLTSLAYIGQSSPFLLDFTGGIRNLVLLGGPINGTPLANTGILLTIALNIHNPIVAAAAGLFLNNGVLGSLSVGSPAANAAESAFLQQAPHIPVGNIMMIGGTKPFSFETGFIVSQALNFLYGFKVSGAYDGLVPISSALSAVIGDPTDTQSNGYTVEKTPVSEDHTDLECNQYTGGKGQTYLADNKFTGTLDVPANLTFTIGGVTVDQTADLGASQWTFAETIEDPSEPETITDIMPSTSFEAAGGVCPVSGSCAGGANGAVAIGGDVTETTVYGPPCVTDCVVTTSEDSTGFYVSTLRQQAVDTLLLNERSRVFSSAQQRSSFQQAAGSAWVHRLREHIHRSSRSPYR